MSSKTKTTNSKAAKLYTAAQQGGLLLMSAAVTLGMLELPDRPNNRVILPSQPAFAWANENHDLNNGNTLRRESEESAPHYISYSVAQRTPARSGRH
jgi:hypothetical protein